MARPESIPVRPAVLATRPAGSSALAAEPAAGAPKKEIKPGTSVDEVRRILGKPKDEVVFGNKSSWTYPSLTVIFEDGRVKEVKS